MSQIRKGNYILSQILTPQVWLNVADTTSFTLSGTNVTGMTDRSTNGYSFTVPSGNPTYNSSISGIRFQSTNQYFSYPAAAINNTSAYAFILVARFGNTSQYLIGKQWDYVNSNNVLGIGKSNGAGNTSGNLYFNVGNGTTQANSGATGIQLNTPYIIIGYFDGTNFIFRVNGQQLSSTAAGNFTIGDSTGGTPSFGTWIVLGTGQSTNDWTFHEFIFTRTFPGLQNIYELELFLAQKWNLLGSMSSQNPYFAPSYPLLSLRNQVVVQQTTSFTGTGTIQTFTVPAGVFQIRFFLWGAGGIGQNGTTNTAAAGAGAFVEGNLTTVPGTIYYIIVGRTGQSGLANGGGTGGGTGAGGGGFSGIFSGSPAANNVIAIAGGGGGSGFNGNGFGGGGGYPNGSSGVVSGTGSQGGGGTQSSGGTGGAGGGISGSQLAGGQGGSGDNGGGGGGGGWYGGGGGILQGAGGGGSSTYTSIVISPYTERGGSGPSAITPTPPGGRSSPYWVSPLGSAGQNGLVVIGYNSFSGISSFTSFRMSTAVPVTAQTFDYTGANQTFTVPGGKCFVYVYMWGAGGGGINGNGGLTTGGAGAMVQGVLKVLPGQSFTIIVGGGGNVSFGNPFGGGGSGAGYGAGTSAQGGGRSAIQLNGVDIVTAGGGGGGGYAFSPGGSATFSGTANPGFTGTGGAGGGGGTQTSGGAGGGAGGTGTQGQGGNGGADWAYGGGGGGGWWGGGGGSGSSAASQRSGGGGGGSSYTANLQLIPGQTVFGFNSSDGNAAPNTSSPYYAGTIARGGITSSTAGGNGRVVIVY